MVNYSNRNASVEINKTQLATVYSAAVLSSIGMGLGVKRIMQPFGKHFSGNKKLFMNFIISYIAIASAGFINCMLMRSKEMKEGISLFDHEG